MLREETAIHRGGVEELEENVTGRVFPFQVARQRYTYGRGELAPVKWFALNHQHRASDRVQSRSEQEDRTTKRRLDELPLGLFENSLCCRRDKIIVGGFDVTDDLVHGIGDRFGSSFVHEFIDGTAIELTARNTESPGESLCLLENFVRNRNRGFHSISMTTVDS